MAMNATTSSYARQHQQQQQQQQQLQQQQQQHHHHVITAQIHNFLKDKQAWENAIAVYQGPDPMDHWYNYICWYENHALSDLENKYRETLERCLTIFEHSDYYRQDARMVRLWLKYIDMQPNPLHFYQVLYQRGTGRQVAMFYIGWANFYESVQAYKEAESVYNLGFTEKAQPYGELHHAHSKFIYTRNVIAQQQQQQVKAVQQQQQQALYQQQQQQAQAATYAEATQIQQQQQHMSATNFRPVQIYQQQMQAHFQQQQQQQQQQIAPTCRQEQQNFSESTQHVHTIHELTLSNSNNSSTSETSHLEQQNGTCTQLVETQAVGCIRLPRNFASYSRNNDETWKPALTLEEPDDPSRICHYSKHLVYPVDAGIEYSPEELLAQKYKQLLALKPNKMTQQQQQQQCDDSFVKQQQKEQTLYLTAEDNETETNNNSYQNNSNNEDAAAVISGELVNETEDEDDADGDANVDDEDEDDFDDDYVDSIDDADDEVAQQQQQEQQKQQQQYTYSIKNYGDDQIEASTIKFSMNTAEQGIQNKSIKIKFKKERPTSGDALNGRCQYSAYTIERIYQPDVPVSPQSEHIRQRNGNSFHPYMLGQTSTPKVNHYQQQHSETNFSGSFSVGYKRSKSKLKRIQSKYTTAVYNSNSNSSSADQPNDIKAMQAVTATDATADVATAATAANTLHSVSFNDNANYSFSSATAFDNSNCSITSAVGRLNFRDTSNVAGNNNNNTLSNNNNNNNNSNATALADFSMYQENSYFATQHDSEAKARRLVKALETIERHMAKEAIDPFNSELCRAFLTKLDFPGAEDHEHANYKIIQTPLPKIANMRTLSLPDDVQFNIDKEVGRGSYGSVYKATDVRTNGVVALKYQKPPNIWEIYICDQVLKRIQEQSVLPGLMDISTVIIAPNASLIATEFSPYGSLLDINNKIRQATTKVMHESLVMHFSAQICTIIHQLHSHKIIHADIKPDNFLLMRLPSTDLGIPSLRLIDFGCAIDMTLFPEADKTKFRKVIQTDGFTCIEMQEGRPWSYETDLFCIAGTVHVMLFGEYMQLQKRAGIWDIRQKLPRYLKKHVWGKFFGDMLNIKVGHLPNLLKMRDVFEEEAYRMDSELQNQIRSLSNILRRR